MTADRQDHSLAHRERIRARLAPFDPIPTGVSPKLSRLKGIKAVAFDVYGTLMLSSAGDIAIHNDETKSARFEEAASAAGFTVKASGRELDRRWHQLIREEHRRRKAEGVQFPEVEIRDIWKAMIDEGLLEPPIDSGEGPDPVETLALEYELLINGVAKEPALLETLRFIRDRGLPLGIVSNAQFYTPIILETIMELSLDDAGFDAGLCVWSFEERAGKPSTALYEKLAAHLAARNVRPSEVLYVGNDMLKDILPASRTGFQTVLYAGDRRSLRMREDHEACRGIEPDAVVTSLAQISDLLTCVA